MKEYPKIQTIYKRDAATKHKRLLEGEFSLPELEYLAWNKWTFTEKVDGTNIRVMWDGEKATFGGKTDAAQLYAPLFERLQTLFYAGALARIFSGPACLYGEGHGAKIQKGGGNYCQEPDFALFDICCGDTWLERHNVEEIGNKLECKIVPIVGRGPLIDAIEATRAGQNSAWGNFLSEGLVMRPAVEMLNRRGHRIITKIKHKDFQ